MPFPSSVVRVEVLRSFSFYDFVLVYILIGFATLRAELLAVL